MTGKRIRLINVGHEYDYGGVTFAWSPDSKYLAAGFADRTVKIMDVMTGEIRLTYTGHADSVNQVAWSPDGKYLASASNDKTIQVWDAVTGRLLLTNRGYPNPLGNPIWSSDSKYIASSDDRTIRVWDAMTGKLRLTYKGHSEAAYPLAWSPDGKYIASGGWDATNQVWDAMTGKHMHTFQGASFALAWSPDGKYIAFGSIFKQGEQPNDSNAHVVDATTWSIRLTYTGHLKSFVKDNVLYPQSVMSVAWSPDGKYIASGSSEKTVQVWIAP
jgi:WD40 repeat protein